MNIDRKTFSDALDRVARFAQGRNLPICHMARLEASKSRLTIAATNLECHGVASCDCEGDLEPVCASAACLVGLAKIAHDLITLESKDHKLRFISNGTAELSTLPADEFPPFPDEKAKAIGVPVVDLAECIEAVAWAADPKSQGVWEPCVCVETKAKSISARASDRYCAAAMERPVIAAESEFLLQAKYAREFCEALCEDDSEFRLSERWAVAKSPSLCIAIRLVDGKTPNFKAVLTQECKPIGDVDIAPLREACSTVALLGHEDSWLPVDISFNGAINLSFVGKASKYSTVIEQKAEKVDDVRLDSNRLAIMLAACPNEKMTFSRGEQALFAKFGDYTGIIQLCHSAK